MVPSPVPNNVNNPALYERIKKSIHTRLKKQGKGWGMYSSSELSRKYKEAGGTYSGKKPTSSEGQRWYKEKWKDEKGNVCGSSKNKGTKKCRPTVRVNSKTPVTWDEMSPSEKKRAVREKKKVGMGRRTSPQGNMYMINPHTGRKIKIGGPTHKKLMNGKHTSPRGASPKRKAPSVEEFKRREEKKLLYKPFPAKDGKHKYSVYVKSESGGKHLIHFGYKSMQHYKDKIGYYSSKDHLDKKRLERFRSRFKNKYDPNDKDNAIWWAWNKLW